MSIANSGVNADAGLRREPELSRTFISAKSTRVNDEKIRISPDDKATNESKISAIRDRVSTANEQLAKHGVALSFSYDHETGEVTVSIVAKDSGEVVAQIPQPPMLFDASSGPVRDDRGVLVRTST